ncbi:MAG: hypothetical protein HYS41_02320 [Candidatus Omnitrophica bacterium]|nr:hypothetical protein [Candidatus Omnitrophota bacterium]
MKHWFLIVFLLAGCATARSLDDTRLKTPGRVVSDTYDFAFDEVYRAARQSVLDLEFVVEREVAREGKIYAKTAPNMAKVLIYKTGFGEHVGVYVTPLSERQTKVEVATQKSNRLEVGFRDYRRVILKLIRARLEGNKAP